jgi:hypothetical protein
MMDYRDKAELRSKLDRLIGDIMNDVQQAVPHLDADTPKYRAMWEAWVEKRRQWASVLEQIKLALA